MNDTINILLVEDEPDLVLIIRNTLTSQGFNVRTAMDGEEGLRKLYAEKPDFQGGSHQQPGHQAVKEGN